MERHINKREYYFKQENFQLNEKTETILNNNRKKYVSSLLNQRSKIYNLKKKKNLQIDLNCLELAEEYKKFYIKNIVKIIKNLFSIILFKNLFSIILFKNLFIFSLTYYIN